MGSVDGEAGPLEALRKEELPPGYTVRRDQKPIVLTPPITVEVVPKTLVYDFGIIGTPIETGNLGSG
jgi:hypothetical protein